MPGNSWQNLKRGPSSPSSTAGEQSRLPHSPLKTTLPTGSGGKSPAVSPQIDALLQRRQELENNLNALIQGGPQGDAREAARFSVPTFAQRQAQQRQWEQHRESQQRAGQQQRTNPMLQDRGEGLRSPLTEQMRTGLRNFQQPVDSWLSTRDSEQQRVRDRVRGSGRDAQTVTQPLRSMGEQLSSAGSQLRDLDRKLADEGLEDERKELKSLGADKILKADKTLQKVNGALDAPQKAVKHIDDFWRKRGDQISGAMDRFGPYVENAKRRLSTEMGGSGDLFERMQRNRERALERKQQQRKEEMRDQARRDRAQRLKKEREE